MQAMPRKKNNGGMLCYMGSSYAEMQALSRNFEKMCLQHEQVRPISADADGPRNAATMHSAHSGRVHKK